MNVIVYFNLFMSLYKIFEYFQDFIIGALKIIFLLGTLIVIHEFGHFIVAKMCGIKVLKFSIGFGPKIYKKQGKETEYSLRALPLGGFVQLEGEDEDSNDPRSYSNKPAWQRILVLSAGVVINIIFALFIYICINMNSNIYSTAKIEDIPNNIYMDIEKLGLNIGDEIYKINGQRIYNSFDVTRIVSNAKEDNFEFEVIRNNNKEIVSINIPTKEIGYIGVSFVESTVYSVQENSAGEAAGLKPNDRVISINGETKDSINEYLNIIKMNPNNEIKMLVQRDNESLNISLIPETTKKRTFDLKFEIVSDLPFVDNLNLALNETAYYLRANILGILELFSGNTENVEVQGIVGISQQISKTEAAADFFYMMSAISLSLGIMNLLPIPGLDGGKIIFTLIEIIMRKPVNKEIEGTLTLAGFAVLILLMIVVTISDVTKLF